MSSRVQSQQCIFTGSHFHVVVCCIILFSTVIVYAIPSSQKLLKGRFARWAGPFCHRALLTLAEKHIPYKEEYIDFANKPKW